jgi:hypothetical protein
MMDSDDLRAWLEGHGYGHLVEQYDAYVAHCMGIGQPALGLERWLFWNCRDVLHIYRARRVVIVTE